jgi:hypothetical protein
MASNDTLGTRADDDLHEAVEALGDDRSLGKSEAVEVALRAGLSRLGYRPGGKTPAQQSAESLGVGVFTVGITLIVLSALGSVALLYAGVTTVFGALGVFASARVVIPRVEPGLTKRLPKIEVSRYGR